MSEQDSLCCLFVGGAYLALSISETIGKRMSLCMRKRSDVSLSPRDHSGFRELTVESVLIYNTFDNLNI